MATKNSPRGSLRIQKQKIVWASLVEMKIGLMMLCLFRVFRVSSVLELCKTKLCHLFSNS